MANLLDEYVVRPKIAIYFGHQQTPSYDMRGVLINQDLQVHVPQSSYNFGAGAASAEINRTFKTSMGMSIMPYVELGAQYEFARQNDGYIVAGDLTSVSTSPWSGLLGIGIRAEASSTTMLEARARYLSVGVRDLHAWEIRLFVSHAF